MSKRDTFERNITGMTGEKTLEQAIGRWRVERVIDLNGNDPEASCELCGTRFRHGAVIEREQRSSRKLVTITVGGTCLRTVLLRRFTDPKFVSKRRYETNAILKKLYSGVVDLGAWITWIVENAPPEMAPIVTDLLHLGLVESDAQLQQLIRFHDENRLYSREALLPDWKAYADRGMVVPESLTIDAARLLQSKPHKLIQTAVPQRESPAAEHLDEIRLIRHFKMGELLQFARFKFGKTSSPDRRMEWVKEKLEGRSVTWRDWLWMLNQYEKSAEVRKRVNFLVEAIFGELRLHLPSKKKKKRR